MTKKKIVIGLGVLLTFIVLAVVLGLVGLELVNEWANQAVEEAILNQK